jgi:hypothetical protein
MKIKLLAITFTTALAAGIAAAQMGGSSGAGSTSSGGGANAQPGTTITPGSQQGIQSGAQQGTLPGVQQGIQNSQPGTRNQPWQPVPGNRVGVNPAAGLSNMTNRFGLGMSNQFGSTLGQNPAGLGTNTLGIGQNRFGVGSNTFGLNPPPAMTNRFGMTNNLLLPTSRTNAPSRILQNTNGSNLFPNNRPSAVTIPPATP